MGLAFSLESPLLKVWQSLKARQSKQWEAQAAAEAQAEAGTQRPAIAQLRPISFEVGEQRRVRLIIRPLLARRRNLLGPGPLRHLERRHPLLPRADGAAVVAARPFEGVARRVAQRLVLRL